METLAYRSDLENADSTVGNLKTEGSKGNGAHGQKATSRRQQAAGNGALDLLEARSDIVWALYLQVSGV